MTSQEYIILIQAKLQGDKEVSQKIKEMSKNVDEMAGKQVDFPWLKGVYQPLQQNNEAMANFAKELNGFNIISAKTNDIFKEGEQVGSQSVITFKNFAGETKTLTTAFDEAGKITKQGFQNIGTGAALGLNSVKDFTKELDGFAKTGTKLSTFYKEGQESGLKSIETFQNQEGAIKSLSQTFDKSGNIISQSMQDISKNAPLATYAVKDFTKELDGFTKIGSKNTTIFKENNEQISKNVDIYRNQEGAIRQVTTEVDKNGKVVGQSLNDISKGATQSAGMMEQMGMAMKRALIVAPVWMIVRGAIQSVTNTIGDQLKFLLDLEEAMTRIKIVGKGTAEEYAHLQSTLVSLSSAYGLSSAKVAEAAVLFAQQGKSVREVITLTQAAMLAAQVLGTDTKSAVESLTAAMMGFQISTSDSISIVDKWINVEKQFAVTAKDLSEATKVAGASANQLGVTFSEFLGDVTAIVEVTRKSGSDAARGLSFMYARLFTTGQKTIEQLTKIPFYLDASGKASNEISPKLRSVADILGDLAGKWNTLEKGEKLEIATSLGSKRQMVAMNALMQNYSHSLDARIASLTSAGSAEKAFNLVQEQTTFKLKQVSSAWNVLTTALGDTSAFKKVISGFDEWILGMSSLINYEKAYGAIVARRTLQDKLSIETRYNEITSIEELIALRENLAKAPQTAENIARFDTVNKAINEVIKKEPKIKLALEAGKPEELKKLVESITKTLTLEKIKLDVELEFGPQIGKEREKLKELLNDNAASIDIITGKADPETEKQVLIQEQKIQKLYKDQAEAVESQYKILQGKNELEKGFAEIRAQSDEDELQTATALTQAELDRLNLEKQLILNKGLYLNDEEKQLQLEKELISNAKTLYGEHERKLKLGEIENKLIEARIQKQNKEKDTVKGLLFQYEKADMFERSKIQRKLEIQTMSPESQEATFRSGNLYDRNLMLDMEGSLDAKVTDSMARILAGERGRWGAREMFTQPSQPVGTGVSITPGAQVAPTQITNYGAKNINVTVDAKGNSEEMAKIVGDDVKSELLNNVDFQKAFTTKIRPNL